MRLDSRQTKTLLVFQHSIRNNVGVRAGIWVWGKWVKEERGAALPSFVAPIWPPKKGLKKWLNKWPQQVTQLTSLTFNLTTENVITISWYDYRSYTVCMPILSNGYLG